MSGLEKLIDRGGNVCEKCEASFDGLKAKLCPACRGGELEFVNLGTDLFGADSPKMGEGRRYICMRGNYVWHVHVGISPVHRGGRPLPFGSLHEAKGWCRDFERRLGEDADDG